MVEAAEKPTSTQDSFALKFSIGEALARFQGRTIDDELVQKMEQALNTDLQLYLENRRIRLLRNGDQITVQIHD